MADKASVSKEAQKYLAKGQIDKAIAEWEKFLASSPDANSFNTIGDLYLRKDDRKTATEMFHKAAGLFRKDGFSLKALALYKKILNVNSSDSAALFALGELNEEKNIATDAIKYYLAAGDLYIKSNARKEAGAAYGRIIKLAAANLSLRKKIAELYSREGYVEEAAAEYVAVGRMLIEQGTKAEGKSYLERALEIRPSNRPALIELANMSEGDGDLGAAIGYLKEAAKIPWKGQDLPLKLAGLCFKAGDLQGAEEYANSVLQADPSNMEAKRIIAEAYISHGNIDAAWEQYAPVLDELIFKNRFDEAIGVLNTFKDVEPVEARRKLVSFYKQKNDNESVLRELKELGNVLEESGMNQEALACYKEAQSIAPDDSYILEKLAQIEPPEPEEDEKSFEEKLLEADLFIGYGMVEEAKKSLESLKLEDPSNPEVHLKLKSIYKNAGEKEQAVTECIVLSEIYKRDGNLALKDQIISEAFSIYPEDPRLTERFGPPPEQEEIQADQDAITENGDPAGLSGAQEDLQPAQPEGTQQQSEGEECEEELAEAGFYMSQGLYAEAEKIFLKYAARFPEKEEIQAQLEEIQKQRASSGIFDGLEPEMVLPAAEGESINLEEVLATGDAEPALDKEVMDIFEEFKKGLETQLEAEDTETHYNLGIAYKEMGLLDDAIREFKAAQQDPALFVNSASMLGICYMEKEIYAPAIDALQSALMKADKSSDARWGLKYDLALAFEKNGNIQGAYDLYVEIYGWDSKFRDVGGKLNEIKDAIKKTGAGHIRQKPVAEAAEIAGSPAESASIEQAPLAEQPPDAARPAAKQDKTRKSRVSYI